MNKKLVKICGSVAVYVADSNIIQEKIDSEALKVLNWYYKQASNQL